MKKAPGTHILIAEAFRHRVGATGWAAAVPHLSAILYLSAQVSVGDAATADF